MRLDNIQSAVMASLLFKDEEGRPYHDFIFRTFDELFRFLATRKRVLRRYGIDSFKAMTNEEQIQVLKDHSIDWWFGDGDEDIRAQYMEYVLSNIENLSQKERLEYLLKFVLNDMGAEGVIEQLDDMVYTINVTNLEWQTLPPSTLPRIQLYVDNFWPIPLHWDGKMVVSYEDCNGSIGVSDVQGIVCNEVESWSNGIKKPPTSLIEEIVSHWETLYTINDGGGVINRMSDTARLFLYKNGQPYTPNALNMVIPISIKDLNTDSIRLTSCFSTDPYNSNGAKCRLSIPKSLGGLLENMINVNPNTSVQVLVYSASEVAQLGLEIRMAYRNSPTNYQTLISIEWDGDRFYFVFGDIANPSQLRWYHYSELDRFNIHFVDHIRYGNLDPEAKPVILGNIDKPMYEAGKPMTGDYLDPVYSPIRLVRCSRATPAGVYRGSMISTNTVLTIDQSAWKVRSGSGNRTSCVWVLLMGYDKDF